MTETTNVETLLEDENLPKELREYAQRMKAKAEEQEQKAQEYQNALRDRELQEFLSEKGLPDEAKDLIGDQKPEEWYEKYGKLFGTSTASQGDESPPAGDESEASNQQPPAQPHQAPAALTPEQMAAMQGIVSQTPQGQSGQKSIDDQMTEAISGAKSVDDVYRLLANVPGVYQG